ncbi:MAG: transposase [wastewater metagenome]|nr:transposase [Candidatus Loosdrechtia aerotolerans]
MKKQRKSHSGQEKVKILRRHFVDQVPVSDLCDEYGLHPSVFYRWQKILFENGASAFELPNGAGERKRDEKVKKLEEKLAHKNEVIAEIMFDHVKLKKSLGEA